MIENGIIIPVHPYMCKFIIDGFKTIILRRTVPKIKQFTCYIYCQDIGEYPVPRGKVIGKFQCEVESYEYNEKGLLKNECLLSLSTCCMSSEIYKYLKGKPAYGFKITDLQIYYRPLCIEEFTNDRTDRPLSMPPKDFQYVYLE